MSARSLGARERVELVASILAGEMSAKAMALEFDVSERFVTRWRAQLRREGHLVPVPEPETEALQRGARLLTQPGGPWSWR